LKHAGVAAVVAGSFARIFYRNAINVGLPVIVCPSAVSKIAQGEETAIDMGKGEITLSNGERLSFVPLPDFLLRILQEGGLVPYTQKRLREGR
jgi:3-isopropylmalate/(R)-2-methylmalate dehydratase small subunit